MFPRTKRSKRRDAPTILFVYGTLKRGQRNHFLMHYARFLGEAVTAPLYTLLDLGSFPGMIPGGSTAVHGELYEVEPDLLARLDRHEGVPRFYNRISIQLENREFADGYVLIDSDRIEWGSPLRSGSWASL